jgi:hypothetical protein
MNLVELVSKPISSFGLTILAKMDSSKGFETARSVLSSVFPNKHSLRPEQSRAFAFP